MQLIIFFCYSWGIYEGSYSMSTERLIRGHKSRTNVNFCLPHIYYTHKCRVTKGYVIKLEECSDRIECDRLLAILYIPIRIIFLSGCKSSSPSTDIFTLFHKKGKVSTREEFKYISNPKSRTGKKTFLYFI